MRWVMNRYGVASDGSDLTRKVQQADQNRPPAGYQDPTGDGVS